MDRTFLALRKLNFETFELVPLLLWGLYGSFDFYLGKCFEWMSIAIFEKKKIVHMPKNDMGKPIYRKILMKEGERKDRCLYFST